MTETETLDPDLLAMLVCPVTRKPLRYDQEAQELISDAAMLAYPIREGIPIMLEGEARKIEG
ncbi:MAG: Trm112 family protein [Parvularcula sp.]